MGDFCQIGHMVVLRKGVRIGHHVTISHLSNIERSTVIGSNVRISALTHITGACVIENDVQIGARVATINDNQLARGTNPDLKHPIFRVGCRVGTGVTSMGGVEVGAGSLVVKIYQRRSLPMATRRASSTKGY
ncbi:MAG: hypothetical protein AB2992_00585 [Candidatus Symbiodolus clandestinus]